MLPINTILFPTDHSACAEHAFAHAAFLADRFDADIHVLHVRGASTVPSFEVGDFEVEEDAIAHQLHLDRLRTFQEAQKAGRVPHVKEVEATSESAASAITAYARDHRIDLVVMGTHGRHGLSRVLNGSVAEEVVRRATCPVLTVRDDEAVVGHPERVDRILVPVDGAPWATDQIRYALELADLYDATVEVLHVVDDEALTLVYGTEVQAPPAANIVEDTRRRVEAMVAQVTDDLHRVRVEVALGLPARQILTVAEAHHADLIVMGTHGRTGLSHLILGSVAEAVVRSAPCPVLTLSRHPVPVAVARPAADAAT